MDGDGACRSEEGLLRECYFRCNLLCALNVDEPCVTYRPDHPEGLRPPRQMRLNFRDERWSGRVRVPLGSGRRPCTPRVAQVARSGGSASASPPLDADASGDSLAIGRLRG